MMSYPESYARQNCCASEFAEIAIGSYYEIVDRFEKYKENNVDSEIVSEVSNVYKNQMKCCVFSEMAVESLLNDYAAACLGDRVFYDEYDKLSIIGKLQLIVQFLFSIPFNKSKSYYSLLKSLVKERNRLVHNKSESIDADRYREIIGCYDELDREDFDLEKDYKETYSIIKSLMLESKGYIKAMVAVSQLLSENDEEHHSFFRLFGGVINLLGKTKAKAFAKEFNFKWGEGILGLRD